MRELFIGSLAIASPIMFNVAIRRWKGDMILFWFGMWFISWVGLFAH